MPRPTPFHSRTAQRCKSLRWKDWAGYYAVCAYDAYPEREYFAFRHAAGVIDVTPLYKYDLRGKDAAAFLSRITVRNLSKLKVGQVTYLCWCDDDGKIVDDGTVARLDEHYYRMTAAEPSWSWLWRYARGYDVAIEDVSDQIATLSIQGPNSLEILDTLTAGAVRSLRFFRIMKARIDKIDALISRTGYTGDLGYEVWVRNDDAEALWDALMAAGKPWRIEACGLDAMDITRVEAGFIMNNVDYYSAQHCLIESRKSTPYELALDWMVELEREPFIGQQALQREFREGPKRVLVGLDIDWNEIESHFAQHGLPPSVPAAAWRSSIPIYEPGDGRQIGYGHSGAWSPVLKKNLALATVEPRFGAIGATVRFEVTVEHTRRAVKATVAPKPFFDPPRKKR